MKELKIAIDEFKNLNILDSSLSYEEFTKYINSTKVLRVVEKILHLLNNKISPIISPIISPRIFISGWFILKYHVDIFTNKNDLEKLIIEKIITISKIIILNNLTTNEDIDKFSSIIYEYEKQFILWKNLDKNKSINEFVKRYTSINKSIELLNNTRLELKENILYELKNQKEDIINIAIKFDKKINKDFFDKSYTIYSKIEKITEEAYWDLLQKELAENNYNLVLSNLEFIINTLCSLTFDSDNIKQVFDIQKIKERLNNNNPEYFYILANSFYYQWRKLSSPFRDIDYNSYILQLNINNYHDSIISFIKNNMQIIDNIYLDLMFLKNN